MDEEKMRILCTNLMADLYGCRNFLENGLQIKAYRKLQGAITRSLELFKQLGVYHEPMVKKDNS